MRRWLRFGLVDLFVAIVLLPPGVILTFQATLLLLGGESEPKIESALATLDGPIVVCDLSRQQMTERDRLQFLKGLVVDCESKLAAGELDLTEFPDIEERLVLWRADVDRLELKLAAQDFLRQPDRDEFRFASEGSR